MSWNPDDSDGYGTDNSDAEVEEDFVNHATVVILDNSEKMFEKSDSEEYCPFQNCLEALYNALDKHVFSQWSSRLRIQFLDGREHGVFYNLSRDIIEIMKKLLEEKEKPVDELKAIYCSQGIDTNVFYESMVDACDSLRKGTQENDTKNIVILTNDYDCNNCDADNDDLERVIERMQSNKIDLIVLPLASEFKWTKFYGKLVQKVMNDSSIEDMIEEGFEDADSLVEVLDNFVQPKKSVNVVKFFYGPRNKDKCMLLQVRKAFKHKKLNHNAKVDPKTMRECITGKGNKEPNDETENTMGLDTDDLLDDERMWSDEFEPQPGTATQTNQRTTSSSRRTWQSLANDSRFGKTLRTYGYSKTLRLLYLCKKRTSAHYVNKPAFIIEPYLMQTSNDEVRKQIKLFQHFWKHCSENDKVLICTYVGLPRQKFYLVQLEPKSKNDYNYFMAQYLPFHNGIKENATEEIIQNPESSGVDLTVMKELINKMTVSDSNRTFQVESFDFETKAALIKGVLLSVKQEHWEPPEKNVNWPTQEQISSKLGGKLENQFNQAYISHVLSKKKK